MEFVSRDEIARTDRRIEFRETWQPRARAVGYLCFGITLGLALAKPENSRDPSWTQIAFLIVGVLAMLIVYSIEIELSGLRARAHSGPRLAHDHWCTNCHRPTKCDTPYNCKKPDQTATCAECVGNDLMSSQHPSGS